MAHVRQSRPDSGLDFKVHVLKPLYVVPSSPGSGTDAFSRASCEVKRRTIEKGTTCLFERLLPESHSQILAVTVLYVPNSCEFGGMYLHRYRQLAMIVLLFIRSISLHTRCRSNSAHMRQTRPHSGRGFMAKFFEMNKVFAFRLVAVALQGYLTHKKTEPPRTQP